MRDVAGMSIACALSACMSARLATAQPTEQAVTGEDTSVSAAHIVNAHTPVRVMRRGDRVWLDGARNIFQRHVEEVETGRSTPWAERSDTYMYLAQLRIAGWEGAYAELMAVAGYATSFAYAPRPRDRWMAHYFPVPGRDDRIAHATGFRCRWRQYKEPEDYWRALKNAIDSGRAVHAPNEEDVLFIGYREAENPGNRTVMPIAIVFVDRDEWTWQQFATWHGRAMVNGWFGCLEEPEDPWAPQRSAAEVIALMVQVARGDDPRRREYDGVIWGIAGVEAYAEDLADMSKSGAPEDQGGYFQGGWRGCHNVMPQMSGRPAAATYLDQISGLFPAEIRDRLCAAAAHYRDATDAWRVFDRQLGRALEDLPHDEAWQNPKHRAAGAAAVRRAAEHEQKALAVLQSALQMLGDAP